MKVKVTMKTGATAQPLFTEVKSTKKDKLNLDLTFAEIKRMMKQKEIEVKNSSLIIDIDMNKYINIGKKLTSAERFRMSPSNLRGRANQ